MLFRSGGGDLRCLACWRSEGRSASVLPPPAAGSTYQLLNESYGTSEQLEERYGEGQAGRGLYGDERASPSILPLDSDWTGRCQRLHSLNQAPRPRPTLGPPRIPSSSCAPSPPRVSKLTRPQQGLQSILAPLYARGASDAEIAEVTARAEVFFAQSCVDRKSVV